MDKELKPETKEFLDKEFDRIFNEMEEASRCIKCGYGACICEDGGKWAAHCMLCDHSVGRQGFYDPCCASKEEAIYLWNEINSSPTNESE